MLSGEWNGARIAVASSPDGTCAGLDASPAESLPEAEERAWWAGAIAGLRQAVPVLARLTLAVPEAWLTSGVAGAARLEAARCAFADRGNARLGIVGRPVAVVARHEHVTTERRSASARRLVVHLGSGEVRTTMCEVTDAAVRVGATSARPLPGASLRASLLAALGPGDGDADSLSRSIRHGRERLRVALAAAARNPAFLEVPVAGPAGTPPDRWPTAREVRDLLAGRSEALRSAVRDVADRSAGAGLPMEVTIMVTGPDREDPLSQEALLDIVPEWAGLPDAPQPALLVAPASAAAEGAALVAAGQVTAEVVPSRVFSLPVHRMAGGRAVSQSVPLGDPGDLGPLVVSGTDQDACPVYVDISTPGGTARFAVPAGESLPSGRYRAGIWPGWDNATLVLRPVDGGEPLLYPLSAGGVGASEPTSSESE
jgi:hypothetical protein